MPQRCQQGHSSSDECSEKESCLAIIPDREKEATDSWRRVSRARYAIAAISVLVLVGVVITLEVFSPYTAWYFVVPNAQLTVDGRREQGWLHRGNHTETLFLTRRDKKKTESYMIWVPHDRQGIVSWRAISRLTVEAARARRRAISRIEEPEAIPREISSRSASVSANRERRRGAGEMPPRGNNTARMQLCGLSKARPISCSDCPAFQRLQTSSFSIAESPNRIPGLMPTPPLQSGFTSDGVASTY
jgi:hypothetical protein